MKFSENSGTPRRFFPSEIVSVSMVPPRRNSEFRIARMKRVPNEPSIYIHCSLRRVQCLQLGDAWYRMVPTSVAGSDGISITNLGKFTAAAWTVNADIVSQSIRRSIPRERLFLTTEVTPSVVKSGTPPIVDRRKPRLLARVAPVLRLFS